MPPGTSIASPYPRYGESTATPTGNGLTLGRFFKRYIKSRPTARFRYKSTELGSLVNMSLFARSVPQFENYGLDDADNRRRWNSDPEDRHTRLYNCGASLWTRFERHGNLADLERAISMFRLAVEYTPRGRHETHRTLSDLAISLRAQFEYMGQNSDIDHAIVASRLALDLTPEGHIEKPRRFDSLATCLSIRFDARRELADLEGAIMACQYSIEHSMEGDPALAARFTRLANCLSARFTCLGEPDDLERTITAQQAAIDSMPRGHPDKEMQLTNLAELSWMRFERIGNVEDLERTVHTYLALISLIPDEDPRLAALLSRFAIALSARFDYMGDLEDLERTIETGRRAVRLTKPLDPDRPLRLTNLAVSYWNRFERLERPDDLERAILTHGRAMDLTTDEHPDRPMQLRISAAFLQDRYKHLGNIDDLERAIHTHQLAVKLTPEGHSDRPLHLRILACYFYDRYQNLNGYTDLERAIATGQLAVDITPEGHPDLPLQLSNIAIFVRSRFQRTGSVKDLERAITLGRLALELTPDGHPEKPVRLYSLGLSLEARFHLYQSKMNFDVTIDHFMKATINLLGKASHRLRSAQRCVFLLSRYPEFGSPEALLLAHSRIIEVFPEIVWLGHSVDRRFQESSGLGELANAAISAFISRGSRYQAVEWMETGRFLVWSQILFLREPLDVLEQKHPQLALALRETSAKLQRSWNTPSIRMSSPHGLSKQHRSSVLGAPSFSIFSKSRSSVITNASGRQRRLAIQYSRLLAEVRSHEGFEDFLRPPKMTNLLPFIEHLEGPVVFINIHSTSCDALVLFPNGSIKHIALHALTEQRANGLRSYWVHHLERYHSRERATAGTYKTMGGTHFFAQVLERLWMWVVRPILHALDLIKHKSPSHQLPHITWCPTSALTQLPLHAAGVYHREGEDKPCAHDFVVSSYTPSLAALLRGHRQSGAVSFQPSVLVISQPETPGLPPLPGTRDEYARLRSVIPPHELTLLEHSRGTVDRTLVAIKNHPWVHLACHGRQHETDPTQSAFALYDDNLTLSMLMGTDATNAELAFLSACQTAIGDEKIPEESAHLAAGMLAVGFKGVVATMWSIGDADAPIIVEAYYKKLLELRSSGAVKEGYTGAAYALHEAVKVLRDHVGEQNFVKWAPFVHFGV